MDMQHVSGALRDRLGPEGSAGLVDLFHRAKKEWMTDVTAIAAERFDRRLTEETAKMRIEMAQGFAALRQEFAHGLADVRQELAREIAAVRVEMAQGFANLRTELLKWMFLFWVGQFFAMAGLIGALVRALRP